jgi:ribose transport system substrate-binding protein
MKHVRPISAALVIGVLALTGCSATSTDASSTTASSDECEYTLGFSDPTSAQEIDQAYGAALTAAGKRVGICVTVLDANLDVNKQLQDINTFTAQGVDAIIAFPLSPGSLDSALAKAQKAGIKTVGMSATTIDTQPTEDVGPYDALFDQNSAVGGARLLTDYVTKEVSPGAQVLGIGIGLPVPSLQYTVKNYEADAGEAGLSWMGTVENPTDDIAGAQQVVGEAVTRFQGEQIDAVMAYNTSSAVGAFQALRNTNSSDAIIVGQNGDAIGVEALEKGEINAMVDIVPWRASLQLIQIVQNLLADESVPSLTFGRPELYTADTLADRLDWYDAIDQIADGSLTCESAGCPSDTDAVVPF